MKKIIINVLLSIIMGIFCIQYAFAGPFGINKGMSFAQVKTACKTSPKHIKDNLYEITPPKTNEMFKTYYVRIDPDYGVYWLKAISNDIYTNNYGERVKSTFQSLVESIRKTYGKELDFRDELKEGSIWGDSKNFMYALQHGDRELSAMWLKYDEDYFHIFIINNLMKDPEYKDRFADWMATNDTTLLNTLLQEKISQYKLILPEDISIIYVGAKAESSSKGYVILEYSFSNEADVKAKTDSVF